MLLLLRNYAASWIFLLLVIHYASFICEFFFCLMPGILLSFMFSYTVLQMSLFKKQTLYKHILYLLILFSKSLLFMYYTSCLFPTLWVISLYPFPAYYFSPYLSLIRYSPIHRGFNFDFLFLSSICFYFFQILSFLIMPENNTYIHISAYHSYLISLINSWSIWRSRFVIFKFNYPMFLWILSVDILKNWTWNVFIKDGLQGLSWRILPNI